MRRKGFRDLTPVAFALISTSGGTIMLARPESRRCVECGTPYEAASFHYWHGEVANGPAYFSDRGTLCSPQCSLTHFRRRETEGTLPSEPAIDPFEVNHPFGRP
jgi:hypothetical protein